MNLTPAAQELVAALTATTAPAEDVEALVLAARREALRLHHPVVARGHLVAVLVRGGADRGLLEALGIDPDQSSAQLLDATKVEVDAHATAPSPPVPAPGATIAEFTCPRCGANLTETLQARTVRLPADGGGRGTRMMQVSVCVACGEQIGGP